MIPKYSYDPIVEQFRNILVVGLGPETGATTKKEALVASAAAYGQPALVRELNVNPENVSTWTSMFDFSPYDAVVVMTNPAFDSRPYLQILSDACNLPVLSQNFRQKPSLNPRYEELMAEANKSILSFLAELLPQRHPSKQLLTELMSNVSDTAERPAPPIND